MSESQSLAITPQDRWSIVPYEGDSPFKKVRVRDESRIRAVARHLMAHECVALLGPPLNEKSRLVHDVSLAVQETGFFQPLYVDLWRARSNDENTFFTSVSHLIHGALGAGCQDPPAAVPDARAFQNYLATCLNGQTRHLALLIDHLQALPHDLVHSLLLALRAAYMERSPSAATRLVAVVTGSMNLAGLSTGPTSPFNIAKAVLAQPLSDEQTAALAQATLEAWNCRTSHAALYSIVDWVGGDYYLVPRLCQWSAQLVRGYRRPQVTQAVIGRLSEQLWQPADGQAPIREAIRLIEEDPDTMLDVLDLLDTGTLPRARARQMITRTGTNRLQLSGAVVLANGHYRFKNQAYRQALARHFTADRVGHVLRIAGRWQEAIDYLAPLLRQECTLASESTSAAPGSKVGQHPDAARNARPQLLEAIVQSIYATGSLERAYELLAQGLELGFGLRNVAIYRASPALGRLELAYPESAAPASIDLQDPTSVEAQTFRFANYALRGGSDEARLVVALSAQQRTIGIVTVDRFVEQRNPHELPPELPDLLGFLSHGANAVENVWVRDAYRKIGQAVLGASTLQPTMHQVLETVAEALGSDYALLYLLDVQPGSSSSHGLPRRSDVAPTQAGATSRVGELAIVAGEGHAWSATMAEELRGGRFGETSAETCLREQRLLVVRGSDTPQDSALGYGRELSKAFLPLWAGGHPLGVLEMGFASSPGAVAGEASRRRLAAFADQMAIAVHNMELLRRTDEALARQVEEIRVGRQIQLSMLPKASPTLPGWEFAAAYRAARIVAGDFYDYFELPGKPKRLGMVIADVADKGVPAALFMALSRTIIRTTALSGRGPASALLRANELILKDSHTDLFLSAVYGAMELETGRLVYANAGHNRPLWYHAVTGEVTELGARGTVLGILEEIRLEEARIDVMPGDVLVFYTDGIPEATNGAGDFFDEERLVRVIAARAKDGAQSLLDAILEAVNAFTGNTEQADDVTCFVVRRG